MKLLDYIKGDRRGKAAHRIEKEAMGDPFLSEALEGFDTVEGDHLRAIEHLRHQVESRVSGRRKSVIVRWSAVAAVLLLFLTIGGVFLLRPDEQDLPPVLAEFTPSPAPLADSPENRPMEMAQATEPEMQEVRSEQNETEDHSVREIFQQQAAPQQELLSISEDFKVDETLSFDSTAQEEYPVAIMQTRSAQKLADSAPATAPLPLTKTDLRVREAELAAAEADNYSSLDEVVVSAYGIERIDATHAETLSRSSVRTQAQHVPAPGQPADGMESFRKYIKENRTVLYNTAGEPVTGKVVLEFRINRNNRPTGIRVIESLSPEADREARRLLENGPDWSRTDNRVRFTIEF